MGLVILIAVFAALLIVCGWWLYASTESIGFTALIAGLCAVVMALIVASVWSVSYRNEHWATCEVTDKDRGGEDGSYRIYTANCDTLANEDSLFRAKFNSSNLWQEIEPGNTYEFLIVGSRVPFMSQFANILDVRLIGETADAAALSWSSDEVHAFTATGRPEEYLLAS